MPTYDYRCSDCGFQYEIFQRMTESSIKKCPECGKNTAVRLISGGAGLIFRGSGFYITDYKNKKTTKEKSTDTKPEKKETAKSSTDKKETTKSSTDKLD